jgi:hypothetical protein
MNSKLIPTSQCMKPLVKLKVLNMEELASVLDLAHVSASEKEAQMFAHGLYLGKEVYENDVYEVILDERGPGVARLLIYRKDRWPVHSWSDFQAIKNQICGPECEAVELYPAESRLRDVANTYHLWVLTDPKDRFPFGSNQRDVLSDYKEASSLIER